MTGRDRMVLIGVVVLAVLAAGWVIVVSPERKKAGQLSTEVSAAKSQLASAEGKLASARTAQSQYAAAYSSMVSLGKAVPPNQEVPSLIYQLSQASNEKSVQFASIAATASSSGSTAAAAAGAQTAGFTQMPFTFIFEGGFFQLEHLFRQLTGFTTRTPAGELLVSGRLLTIQSVKLSPVTDSGPVQNTGRPSRLSGAITATAYVLPASQGLTGGSSAAAPSGATPASSSGAPSSPTAPAIVKATP